MLIATGPDGAEHRYVLAARCLLGREEDCDVHDIFSGARSVGRHHAAILLLGDRYVLQDLGSRKGTLLNDRPVGDRASLEPGDRIGIGDVELRFVLEAAEPEAPPPASAPREESLPPGIVTTKAVLPPGAVEEAAATEGERRKLWALVGMLGEMGQSLEVDESLEHLLTGLFRIFPGAERGFVAILDPRTDQVVTRAVKLQGKKRPGTPKPSQTIAKVAMERTEAVLSLDAMSDPRFKKAQSIALSQVRSVMCAPLLDAGGQAVGILQLDSLTNKTQFKAEDLEVLASIAPQASMVLRYARLHEEALERKTLDRDLDLARRVQLALLPQQTPEIDGYEVLAHYEAAYQIGGDYYDYVPLPDGRWACLVADAAGKGVSAALLTAKLSGELSTYLSRASSGAEALNRMSQSFAAMSDDLPCRFVTLALVVLDPRTHTVELVNAGHTLPLHLRSDGTLEEVGQALRGPALGMFPERTYQSLELRLAPGDVLTLYTDGFSEATNADDALYGVERLRGRVARPDASVRAIVDGLVADVEAFVAGERQSDDMCLICLRRTPSG